MSSPFSTVYENWSWCDGFPSIDTYCNMLRNPSIADSFKYADETLVIEEDICNDDIDESEMRIFEIADNYERSFRPRVRSPRSRRRRVTANESTDRLIAVGRVVNGQLVITNR